MRKSQMLNDNFLGRAISRNMKLGCRKTTQLTKEAEIRIIFAYANKVREASLIIAIVEYL